MTDLHSFKESRNEVIQLAKQIIAVLEQPATFKGDTQIVESLANDLKSHAYDLRVFAGKSCTPNPILSKE